MSRRQLTLLVAGIGVAAALVAAAVLPVPYVILSPGPTLNTLGQAPSGHSLIQISGHKTYSAPGHLNMVTVSYQGGPSDSLNIFTALRAWLTPHEAVVPEAELFPPDKTQKQVVQQDTQQMASSQETATAAALCQLGIKFAVFDKVIAVAKGLPAQGVLRRGDVIKAVDGTPVTCKSNGGALIRSHPVGTRLTLTIARHDATKQVRVRTTSYQGRPVVGVSVQESYKFPFKVNFSVGNIGGPSAGLMFALGVLDKLTPGNLTGGRFIAGTGEITPDGTVGPIGGIQQKMVGARKAGAAVFLTPAANCPDTAGSVPAGMRLIKVTTLNGAVRDLKALAAGHSVPSC